VASGQARRRERRPSDALFVLARWVAKTHGEPEFLWERESSAIAD